MEVIELSKMFKIYTDLKKQDSHTVYLFKSGIFFLCLNEDAMLISNLFNLKINCLNDTVIKCAFPCNSLEKYLKQFQLHNITSKIIDINNLQSYTTSEYRGSQNIEKLLDFIEKIDINKLSVSEAYSALENLKEIANSIRG